MVSGGAVKVGVVDNVDTSEDVLGSALVLDVNVDVFTKEIFETLDGVEKSTTSTSVLSLIMSGN